MTGNIDRSDSLGRRTVFRNNGKQAIKRRELDQIDLVNISHHEALITEHPELSLMIEQNVVVNGAVTQLGFCMSLIVAVCE